MKKNEPRKIRRKMWLALPNRIRQEWAAYNQTPGANTGPNRHTRRASVKIVRVEYNSGIWVKEFCVRLRSFAKRKGCFA